MGDQKDSERTFLDKEEVARRLIDSSIRMIAADEDAVGVQVIVGSAGNLIREYATQVGKQTVADPGSRAKPEFREALTGLLRSHYNFFKHSNFDADKEIDASNLSAKNDLEVYTVMAEFNNAFDAPLTAQMKLFILYIAAQNPNLVSEEVLASFEGLEQYDRSEALVALRQMLATPEAWEEASVERAALVTRVKGYYDGPPHRDMLKRPRQPRE